MLDPQLLALLDRPEGLAPAGCGSDRTDAVESAESVARLRGRYEDGCAKHRPARPEGVLVEERHLSVAHGGRQGRLPVRCYRPEGIAVRGGALIALHGGSWIAGSGDTHDRLWRGLALACQAPVIAPEYALAPERPWPAALDDTVGCVRAVRQTEIDFDIDPARLILLGEEAGGMLAVLAARALHQAGDLPLLAQVLISPILAAPRTAAARYGGDDDTDPVASLAGDRARRARDLLSHLVRQAATGWQLCGGPGESGEQVQWPLEMAPDQLAGLPPTWLLTAGLDPWHGQALAWAARLHAAGITVTHECFEGMVHGFLGMGGALAAAGHGQSRIGQFLRPLLRTPLT